MKINKCQINIQNVKIFRFSILFSILWILYGLNTGTVDTVSYKPIYNVFVSGGWFGSVEPGFALIMYLCAKLGFTYQQFLILFSFIGLLLISKTLFVVSRKPTLVLLLYLLFPFAHDVSGLRNFMAMAIVFWGTRYLSNDDLKSKIKYIITVFVAMSFHITSIVYLILLLTKLSIKKIKFITFTGVCLELIILLSSDALFKIIHRFVPKAIIYVESGLAGTQFYTKIFFVIYYIVILYISHRVFKEMQKEKEANVPTNSKFMRAYSYTEIAYKAMLLSVLFYPIILFDMDFYRLSRNLLLVFYVMITNISYFHSKMMTTKKKILVLFITSIFVIIIVYFFQFLFSFESVILPVFKNNILFEK